MSAESTDVVRVTSKGPASRKAKSSSTISTKTGKGTKVVVAKKTGRQEGHAFAFVPPARRLPAVRNRDFVVLVRNATTMELVQMERDGVPPQMFKFLSDRLGLPMQEVLRITGVPRSTGMRKLKAGEPLSGVAGQAALGMTRLLAKVQDMLANSTSEQAERFNGEKWLGEWITRPQPALGGRKPAELMDTPTGIETVMRVLGAIESGVYL